MKLFESEKTLAFLDIGPLSKGHAVSFSPRKLKNMTHTKLQLVIPKFHGAKLADIPDDQLTEILVCGLHSGSHGRSKLLTVVTIADTEEACICNWCQ